MRKIIADCIYPISSSPIQHGMLILDEHSKIIEILSPLSLNYETAASEAQKLSGIICPGFVNTHCHLELSHLKGKIESGTGLSEFISQLQGNRKNYSESEILEAIKTAGNEMYENGIVALGDICNGTSTIRYKQKNKFYTHSFIELFGFDAARAEELVVSGKQLYMSFVSAGLPASITAHAPYSTSTKLMELIKEHCNEGAYNISIHNQESDEENKLFQKKSGKLLEMLVHFGINMETWNPPVKNSLPFYLPSLKVVANTLLVHNTFTSKEDIASVNLQNLYWCLCPNANLYIENRLPNVEELIKAKLKITIGTDSLASNHQLCIWNELKTIRLHYPNLKLEDLLKWATFNGACYLGIENQFGTLEIGKKPGIVWIEAPESLHSIPQNLT